MAVPSSLSDLSTTAASNSPAGSESIGTSLDDYLRSIQAIIKQGVSKGSDIASASTITPVATSSYFIVTGTTGITSLGETYSWTGRVVVLKFDNTLTLTHSSGLILPGAANISTAAGDVASFVNESTGVWRCVQYQKASGSAVASVSIGFSNLTTNVITGATEDTTPDTSADYMLTYDASTATLKKVLLNKVSGLTDGDKGDITVSSSGATWTIDQKPTLMTAKAYNWNSSSSNTYIDFESIPSWVKRITISYVGSSLSGTSSVMVQVGDSGGVENSGYLGCTGYSGNYSAYTTGFGVSHGMAAANVFHGSSVLVLVDSSTNTWAWTSSVGFSNIATTVAGAGTKSLSATLDRVRITTVGGTDTFDAGTINVMYE